MGSHGGRDTVEEKKKLEPVCQEQEEQDSPAHTLTLGLHTVQQRAAPFLPARRRGKGKGKEGEERVPLARILARHWTRIGCLTGKGRLLSVLTDPAALVPDRGGTVDQSHALSCCSTAHLVCNPHALPPWAPASLPTLPPTCSLKPSLSERWTDQLNGNGAHSTVQPCCHTVAFFLFFFCLCSRLLCPSRQPMHPTKDLTSLKLFDFRLATNDHPDTNKRTDGGG